MGNENKLHRWYNQKFLRESLVDPKFVLMPPLHIQLDLMNQFVKALDPAPEAFKCLKSLFPKLSEAKVNIVAYLLVLKSQRILTT